MGPALVPAEPSTWGLCLPATIAKGHSCHLPWPGSPPQTPPRPLHSAYWDSGGRALLGWAGLGELRTAQGPAQSPFRAFSPPLSCSQVLVPAPLRSQAL